MDSVPTSEALLIYQEENKETTMLNFKFFKASQWGKGTKFYAGYTEADVKEVYSLKRCQEIPLEKIPFNEAILPAKLTVEDTKTLFQLRKLGMR